MTTCSTENLLFTPEAKANLTPMMQQYVEMRAKLSSDTLLLFRLGDFYELFNNDAQEGARLLGITLTQRHGTPMAGIPFHAADTYIGKILQAGRKVAICDQMEDAVPGKLVKRGLTRILTPGTTLGAHQIEAERNHYLLAVQLNREGLQAAWADLSTGEFFLSSDDKPERLLALLNALNPKELILPENFQEVFELFPLSESFKEGWSYFTGSRPISPLAASYFDASAGVTAVTQTLGVLNLDGFGIQRNHAALGAAGAVLHYATQSLCGKPENIKKICEYRTQATLLLDPSTLKNLEIFLSANHSKEGSLIRAIDRTATGAGARLLEQWIAAPLLELPEIKRRQQAVGAFVNEPGLSGQIQELLKKVRDIPRILGRLQNRLQSPRELGGIQQTLVQLPKIKELLNLWSPDEIIGLAKRIDLFEELSLLLTQALKEELSPTLQEGGYIQEGFNTELDYLRSLMSQNMTWIAELEAKEQAQTGIKNLRIKYNPTFGYYIEVTKSYLNQVPAHYIRKQTMTNAERFCTEELKVKEKEILQAEEKSLAKEQSIFEELVGQVLAQAENLKGTAQALAEIDLFIGWSKLARDWDYVCPVVDNSDVLTIDQGRHPVIEQMLKENKLGLAGSQTFVPNDTDLSSSKTQIALITGPNMAGKSTYIRQVALITLLAQIGCWVPAKVCQIGVVDRIFSRVGASDELARGNSTFMVEMNETANILNNATARSLIILDEIGRGTSTYDGLSIAWAVLEHLHGESQQGPKTLFATHYHEMTQLEKNLPRVRNYSVAVKEWNDEIIFVRQVIPGAADRSYGIQVARLAGLPNTVIIRAKEILNNLEKDGVIHLKTGLQTSAAIDPELPTLPEKALRETNRTAASSTKKDLNQLHLF